MNRKMFILLLFCIFGTSRSELKTTSRTAIEGLLHYDDNIVLVDSITDKESFKEELAVNHKWYFQINRLNMIRLGMNLWTERIDAFENENIRSLGSDLQYRSYLTNSVMLNTAVYYKHLFSPSIYYRSNRLSGDLLLGLNLEKKLYAHLRYQPQLKRMLDYFRYDYMGPSNETYFYQNYHKHPITLYGRYRTSSGLNFYSQNTLSYKVYHDDLHDLDYLNSISGFALLDSVLEETNYERMPDLDSLRFLYIQAGQDSVFDTTFFYGQRNVQQKDVHEMFKIGLHLSPAHRIQTDLTLSGFVNLSADDYYEYRGGSSRLVANYRHSFISIKILYQLTAKHYPHRYADASASLRQQDILHYGRLGISHSISDDVTLEFRYARKSLSSNYEKDMYDRNIFSVRLYYYR